MKVQASVTQATLDRQIVGYAVHLFRLQMRLLNANSLIWLWSIVGLQPDAGTKGNSGGCSPHDGALSHAAQTTAYQDLGAGYFDQRQQQRTLPIATPS